MLKIIQRTTIGAIVLLLMPVTVLLSGWTWHPEEGSKLLIVMYWITQTVTHPWGLITSTLFSTLMVLTLRLRFWQSIFLIIIMNGAVAVGQYTKSYMKQQIQAPRPYVIWLDKNHGINKYDFYKLNRLERRQLVSEVLANDSRLPTWLKKHWAYENGFAFPSGHSTFVVSWALLSTTILWPRKYIKTSIAIFIWAIMVMGSRLVLGMHWPQDLIMSTFISWLITTIALYLIDYFCMPIVVPVEEDNNKTKEDDDAS
ncbi:phosphatidylglycerophosphatase B [Pantoea sp. Mhis]|uniref:phosphatidylglycerophosphatase B n=1 Tax=Pantoea sp. Mhis TaxID=2576759 RepID=UPI0013592163|nr:phosphatidylglycerophosphatase B [Pantoea sp. Mhis]MXP56195.1 phosphatidylglycerophosphatase B [Pantoea sp. Mhis]